MFVWVLQEADASMGLEEQEIAWGLGQWGKAYERRREATLQAGLESLKEEGEERRKSGRENQSWECDLKDIAAVGESWDQTYVLDEPRIP